MQTNFIQAKNFNIIKFYTTYNKKMLKKQKNVKMYFKITNADKFHSSKMFGEFSKVKKC